MTVTLFTSQSSTERDSDLHISDLEIEGIKWCTSTYILVVNRKLSAHICTCTPLYW